MFKELLRQQAETVNQVSLEVTIVGELGCHGAPTESNPDDMRRQAIEYRSLATRLHGAGSTYDREAGRLEALALMVESVAGHESAPQEAD
jgi:hypothetical protein